MRSNQFKFLVVSAIFLIICYQKVNGEKEDEKPMEPPQLPAIPSLPTGPITDGTVDCVNEKFFTIQRKNPHLKTWLSDVQGTVERLFAARRSCDSDTVGQDDCVSTWNRSAGVQFLRLGLALFEQKNVNGNPLEILNTFVSEFQKCW